MSLKRYNVTLDEHEAEYLKKKGELSSNLRTLMEKYSVSLIEGAKVDESEISKNSKRLDAIDSKLLKMDTEFREEKRKFETAYRRIHRAMTAQGLTP